MISLGGWHEPVDEVEALVRSAGDYVQPTEDLRPRVLEVARMICGERRAQRCIRHVAMFVVLLAVFTGTSGPGFDPGVHRSGLLASVSTESMFLRAESLGSGNDVGWGLVEAFTELRERQAEVLRLEP